MRQGLASAARRGTARLTLTSLITRVKSALTFQSVALCDNYQCVVASVQSTATNLADLPHSASISPPAPALSLYIDPRRAATQP
ncbi:hypothetical protein J6590_026743 [Homalodisca vitripennis]|nr:hypothetical protein J6590_026743 [Homalodisca vitripennis]